MLLALCFHERSSAGAPGYEWLNAADALVTVQQVQRAQLDRCAPSGVDILMLLGPYVCADVLCCRAWFGAEGSRV